MVTCTRILEFDAGHRLLKHEGRCRNLHGHRYRVEVEAHAVALDGVGRVVDFSVIKEKVGGWIDEYWDHGFIIEALDPLLEVLHREHSKSYQLPNAPTAENLALHLLGISNQLLRMHDIEVIRVRVWETPNCHAEATLGLKIRTSRA